MFKPILSLHINNNDPKIFSQVISLWLVVLKTTDVIDFSKKFYGVYHNYKCEDDSLDLSISIKAPKNSFSFDLIALGDKYREFIVGDIFPENIHKGWREIWELERKGQLDRKYDTDYEEYRPDGTVSIFISIK